MSASPSQPLTAAEETWLTLFKHSYDGICITDGTYTVQDVNPAFTALTGVDAGALIAHRLDDLGKSWPKSLFTPLHQFLDSASDDAVTWLNGRANGKPASTIEVRRRDLPSHKQPMVLLRLRDISQQALELQTLRDSLEHYRDLVEATSQAMMIVRQRKIVYANPACAQMFGFDQPADMVGRPLVSLVHAEDRHAGMEAALTASRVGNAPLYRYYRGVRRDGSIFWYEPRRAVIHYQGKRAVQWSITDVTDQRNLQEQFEQAQRMEPIGRLAGGIAHDFNNILAVIQGNAEFIRDSKEATPDIRNDARMVEQAAQRAAALTRQLLAFSRRQMMQMQVANLNTTVNGLEQMLKRLLGDDVSVVFDLQDSLHPVRCDPSQMEQVLMNLVVNARDAMPEGGTLTVSTHNEELDADYARNHIDVQPGNFVMLSVEDTGTGMDAETQAHIFDPFFTTKEQGKGTGLGLATVYGIVKQMNGTVYVYSEPGRGTVFRVYFPVALDADITPEPQSAESAAPVAAETILLVEDDELVRVTAQRILESAGYTVLPTASAMAAVELASTHAGDIHLVLSDVVMPGLSARQMVERLHSIRKLPILFMSGYSDDSIVSQGILEGQFAFLNKPFNKTGLLRAVQQTLLDPPQEGGPATA